MANGTSRAQLLRLAREATNAWACHARTNMEHAEIARLHAAIYEIAESPSLEERLRAALVGLVGVDGRADLEALDAQMRLWPMPAEDRATTIDAIHALLATLPEPVQP